MREKLQFWRLFSIVFTLLVSCTIVSIFIQKESTLKVVAVKGQYIQEYGGTKIPKDALVCQENRASVFVLEESSGLEEGIYVRKIPVVVMLVEDETVITNADPSARFVRFAPRPLADGERVTEITLNNFAPDQYLVCLPIEFGGGYQIVSHPAGPFPFVEGYAAQLLQIPSESRIYSLEEVESFFTVLPLLGLSAVLAVTAPILALIWAFLISQHKSRFLNMWYISECLVSWIALEMILACVDFPDSLVPTGNMLDFSLYSQLVSTFREGLTVLGESMLLETMSKEISITTALALAAMVTVFLFAFLPLWMRKRRASGKHFH